MSTTHQDKSSGKPRQRGRKADQRGQKSAQQRKAKLDRTGEAQSDPMVASTVTPASVAAAPAPLIGEVLPPDVLSIGPAAPADCPVSIQTIANAYADYTMRSIEEGRSFVEKLVGVRSFDKAIEVQTEFARRVYANLVGESQKMCELYGELAKQTLRPWERLAAGMTEAERRIL